ncbi:MAG TPA: hypothetical protein VMF06_09740 [Candidatus Limnocylindria bacterium]|nr:hypothetical protein [Candidatus Limnocylindria bacterium]
MPDHLHFLAAPFDTGFCFDKWVTYWEREFRKLHNHASWRWQAPPFHRRLRDGEKYTDKWNYLRENPARKGLVQNADDWSYQGKLFDIIWQGK